MIQRLLQFFSPPGKGQAGKLKPRRLARADHPISRRAISSNALKVMKRLQGGGFEAYLVGGSVRDLMLGGEPKDFDIATDATPEEVRELFRNSRIIGRRFRIVHVRFGPEIIEVTTFRAHHGNNGQPQGDAVRAKSGMLLRDNVYGSIEEDAARRDFTINALYYTLADFSVLDFANGQRDIQQRLIRMIGDPTRRYQEDPVRMLRAVRFAAKLAFTIEDGTAAPIPQLASMLADVPPARLFDEVLKLFMTGHGARTLPLLERYGLFAQLFPASAEVLDADPSYRPLLHQALANTDARIAADKPVTPAFLYAAALWPAFREQQQQLQDEGLPVMVAVSRAAHWVIERQVQRTAIPRRFSQPMREIWEMQWRLPRRGGDRAWRLQEHPRFRAAYDFVLLREQAGEDLEGLGDWWTQFQEANAQGQQQLVNQLPKPRKGRGRRRRRRS